MQFPPFALLLSVLDVFAVLQRRVLVSHAFFGFFLRDLCFSVVRPERGWAELEHSSVCAVVAALHLCPLWAYPHTT